MQYTGTDSARRAAGAVLSLVCLLFCAVATQAVEAPATEWATFLGGVENGVFGPKIEPFNAHDSAAGFYVYASGDRRLIAYDSAYRMLWETAVQRGVNDVDEIVALAALEDGSALVVVNAYPTQSVRVFGQTFDCGGQFLAVLNRTNGTAFSVSRVSNCTITAVAGISRNDYVVAGVGAGTGLIGSHEIQMGAEAVFVARIQSTGVWTLSGRGATAARNHAIQSLRLFRHHDTLFDIFAGGSAPAAWSFGGADINDGGVYQLRIHEAGEVLDAQALAPGSALVGLEIPPLANGASVVAWKNPLTGDGSVGLLGVNGVFAWKKPIPGMISAITARSALYVIGTDYAVGDFYLEALNLADGEQIWEIYEHRRSPTEGFSAGLLSDGHLIFAGSVKANGIFLDDFFLRDFNLIDFNIEDAFVAAVNPGAAAPPVFRVSPRNYKTAISGETVVLHSKVWSPGTSTLQWFKNDQPLLLQTNADLALPSVGKGNAGSYYAVASGNSLQTTSAPVVVDITEVNVKTFAGSGVAGFSNDPNPLLAQFHAPRGPAVLGDAILLADSANHLIRGVRSNGAFTYAGSGVDGLLEGAPLTAMFSSPAAIAVRFYSRLDNAALVADRGNGLARSIQFNPQTLAAKSVPRVQNPHFLLPSTIAAQDGLSFYVVGESGQPRVWKVEDGVATRVAANWTFGEIGGVALDARGNIYVADSSRQVIEKIDLNDNVTRLAGVEGVAGFRDGADALFNQPSGLALDGDGKMYVTERGNHAIRRINDGGYVATLAGLGRSGLENGSRDKALFNAPEGLCVFGKSIIVADTGNNVLRQITFETIVETQVDAKIQTTLGAQLGFKVTGNAGDRFVIESTATLGPGANWGSEGVTVNSGESVAVNRPTATRFYRARKTN